MKLLFDENLSPRLVVLLADLFPNSVHVRGVGLRAAEDSLVWNYAKDHDLVIVSKDADMHQRCFVFGAPPKVVWVRLGNCSTTDVPICCVNTSKRLKRLKRMTLLHS
ncbi:MAG TPA: DUF5615 family PIN-like protein [Pyrinomonadaceae bacterium]|nr:DUF5615 family PIN-like protein [Pyrinomonadaceae bacterium]